MTATRPARARRAVFGLALAASVLLAAELALRIMGFSYEHSLSFMEFNFPRPHELHQIFEPDPTLLWRLRPGYDFGQGFPRLNPQGFRGPDFSTLPGGRLRIACLGDSVTFGRPEADFPALLEQRLAAAGQPAQVLNFGVPGYSSYQGRLLLERVLRDYRPGIVIILFGWNDHWLSRGFPDQKQRVAAPRSTEFIRTLGSLRLYQFINHALMHARRLAGTCGTAPTTPRVSADDYRHNLRLMVSQARSNGAAAVLATAPSAISSGQVPDFLVPGGFIRQPQDLATLHRQYNEVARQAAAEAGATLCDLDADFEARGVAGLFTDPAQDLIHPNAEGYALMAEKLAECIRQPSPPAP